MDVGAAVLMPIDVQEGFDHPRWTRLGPRCTPGLERNVARLLAHWRATAQPIVHVRHASTTPSSTLAPGQPGNAFKPEAAPLPGEPVVTKAVHSAFIGTGIEERLARLSARRIVLVGIQTNYCVATTARMAANLGYDVQVVADACATFAQRDLRGRIHDAQLLHDVALMELEGEFATVTDTQPLLANPPLPTNRPT